VFTSAFDAETAVVARGDSRYDVRLSTAWDIGDNANGGYAMLPVLRSLREESGHSDPLSVTTHFLRPIQGGGDARINTSLVRRGRSVSVLTGDLTVAETQRLTVSAVFGDLDDHEPGTGIDISAPLIPEPEECLNRAELLQGVALPIASRIDVRVHPQLRCRKMSQKPAISEGWVRLSDGAPPTALSITGSSPMPSHLRCSPSSAASVGFRQLNSPCTSAGNQRTDGSKPGLNATTSSGGD
jgi:hypothetical protein